MLTKTAIKIANSSDLRRSRPLTRLEFSVAAVTLFWVLPVLAFLVVRWAPVWTFFKSHHAAMAPWVQAILSALAIIASAWIAMSVQRRDHKNQLRGPIEVAIEVARYSTLAVEKTLDKFGSLEAIYNVAQGKEHFDVDGITLMAKLATELPVYELRNKDAARHMLSLSHMMRQLDALVRDTLAHHRQVDAKAFEDYCDSLIGMHETAKRTVKGLREVLDTI
ncbi:hypothetical protein [Achromobacter xylosoxidans]|uniref:hypothetical protein n=1 Tax=Alcaligenes xylosoxydans xylosoxydans TaxID=85698 RepID=UPI001EEAE567|nr:hypothetical protein [Achromobacter xylosoxidans]